MVKKDGTIVIDSGETAIFISKSAKTCFILSQLGKKCKLDIRFNSDLEKIKGYCKRKEYGENYFVFDFDELKGAEEKKYYCKASIMTAKEICVEEIYNGEECHLEVLPIDSREKGYKDSAEKEEKSKIENIQFNELEK